MERGEDDSVSQTDFVVCTTKVCRTKENEEEYLYVLLILKASLAIDICQVQLTGRDGSHC